MVPGEKTGPLVGRNLPEVVNKIVWVRQLIHKVAVPFTVFYHVSYHKGNIRKVNIRLVSLQGGGLHSYL